MEQMKRFILSFLSLLSVTFMYAQGGEISGTVVDATGEPIIGATVMEQGTSNGTVTDIDGNFKIKVEANKTLVFTYIGFQPQELPAQDGMKVVMNDDALSLNEVVVTGYTVQRKADLTGAISTVSVDEIAKQNENNPMKALQGRVPGMNISADGNPSGAATVRIRGIGTLNDNDPLYIIDGVPTKAGMHELNGNDIESIQVLKDAASASIYGSRAANGVIIITTKKGKDGKIKVNFDGSVATSFYTNKIETMNASEWGRAFWQASVNDGLNPNNNNLGYNYDWSYGQPGHVYAEAVFASARHQLAEEDDAPVDFFHAHVVVVYAGKLFFHLDQLVVVGGEHHLGSGFFVLVQVFGDGPGNGYAVVGRGAAADFIEEHQRAVGDVVQY